MSENKDVSSNKLVALVAVALLVCFTAILVAFVATGHPDLAFSILRAIGLGVGGILLLLLLLIIVG
jgi:hypothetical protein